MDAIAATEFRTFLKNEIVESRGTSLLFSSHSLQEIELLADRIIILKNGTIAAMDTLSALKGKYRAESLEQVFHKSTGNGDAHITEVSAE